MKTDILRIAGGSSAGSSRFPLMDLNIRVLSGELNMILCENWDEKDTIARVLAGEEGLDGGTVTVLGENLTLNPERPVVIPQGEIVTLDYESLLNEYLSIPENMWIEEKSLFRSKLNDRKLYQKSEALLQYFKVSLDLTVPVRLLSEMKRAQLELIRHYKNGVRMVVLDEPRRVFRDDQFHEIFRLIRQLCREGMSFLVLATTDHLVQNYRDVFDLVMIIGHGRTIETFWSKEKWADRYFLMNKTTGIAESKQILAEQHLNKSFFDCSVQFESYDRIVLQADRGKLYQMIFGSRKKMHCFREILCGEYKNYEGYMWLDHTLYDPQNLRHAVVDRLCWIDPNNLREQVFEKMSVYDNIVLSRGRNFWGVNTAVKYKEHIKAVFAGVFHENIDLDMKLENVPAHIQQKVLYAKWYLMSPKVLVIENPFVFANEPMRVTTTDLISRFLERKTTVVILTGEAAPLSGLNAQTVFC